MRFVTVGRGRERESAAEGSEGDSLPSPRHK